MRQTYSRATTIASFFRFIVQHTHASRELAFNPAEVTSKRVNHLRITQRNCERCVSNASQV